MTNHGHEMSGEESSYASSEEPTFFKSIQPNRRTATKAYRRRTVPSSSKWSDDEYDSGNDLHNARQKAPARNERSKTRPRKESTQKTLARGESSKTRPRKESTKTRRTMPTYLPSNNFCEDSDCEIISERQFRKNKSSSRAGHLTMGRRDKENFSEESDSQGSKELVILPRDEFMRILHSAGARHLTNYCGDYEVDDEEMDEDHHTFNPTPNVGPSTVGRRYIVDSDEDAESDGGAYGGLDASNSPHRREDNMHQVFINISDTEPSGEELEVNCIVGTEGSSPNAVPDEQREEEEKEHDNAVPSRKKKNGEKTHKRNKLSAKETNIVGADDAPKVKRVRKKSSTAPFLDQSQHAKNSSEAEDEMNMLQSPKQSPLLTQTAAGSPVLAEEPASIAAKDIDCDKDVGKEIGEKPEVDKTDKRERKKLSTVHPSELFEVLVDSSTGSGPLIESESEDESRQALSNPPLPIKFSLDEPEMVVEKTEFQKMTDALMAEGFPIMEQDLSELPEVNSERECSPADDSLEARCARGEHETHHDEEIGIYCIHCLHLVLETEYVLPPRAEKTCNKRRSKRSADGGDLPEFVHKRRCVKPSNLVEPSMKNTVAFKCPDDGTVWDVVPGVKENMFKHQQEGLEYLWEQLAGSTSLAEVKNMVKPDEVGGCMINHAPGTGKTRLTIVFLETYLKVFPDSRPLLIAPAGMLLTWAGEFKKWGFPFPFHNLNNSDFEGNESKKILKLFKGAKGLSIDAVRLVKIFSWVRKGSVLGISYTLFEMLTGRNKEKVETNKESTVEFPNKKTESLSKLLLEKPGLVIMDEGHIARNRKSNLWKALHTLNTDKRVILSGTPFQNSLAELYNLLRLVRPAVVDEIAEDKLMTKLTDDAELEILKSKMLPYVNFHGSTTRQDLPGMKVSVIILKPKELQRTVVETIKGRQHAVVLESKVASLSLHPYLFKHCELEKHPGIDMNSVLASKLNPNEGTKTKFIIELLRLSVAANEKVVIFSQFRRPSKLIMNQLKEVFDWVDGKQILQINGTVKLDDRQKLLEKFNNPSSEARVMLAATKCCSEGISLVGASRVVVLDVAWNPSVVKQALCRAHRIGQNKPVYTYHLMTSGTTEKDKYSKQMDKERISEMVFCSSNGESDNGKNQAPAGCMEDKILEQMVGCAKLSDMFEAVINQPKENFRSTS